jgi:hypothetical protein
MIPAPITATPAPITSGSSTSDCSCGRFWTHSFLAQCFSECVVDGYANTLVEHVVQAATLVA